MNALQKRTQATAKDVSRLEGVVAQWGAERTAKRAELADLEGRIGEEVLADESVADQLTDMSQKLRARIDLADRTAAAAEKQLGAARGELASAQAAEKREQAAKLYAQSLAHEARVNEAADRLRVLDPLATVSLYRPTPQERRRHRADAALGLASPLTGVEVPPFLQAQYDADVLLEEADALEQRVPAVQQLRLADASI